MRENVLDDPPALDDAGSVLLLAPSLDEPDHDACVGLLTARGPKVNVLSVAIGVPPADRLATWRAHTDRPVPDRTVVVSTEVDADADLPVGVDALRHPVAPTDLVGSIGWHLGRWAPAGGETVVCVHSLTALCDRLSLTEVVEVVETLDDRFAAVGASAHYHLDPRAVGRPSLATLRPLFDVVLEHVPEEGWLVDRDGGDADADASADADADVETDPSADADVESGTDEGAGDGEVPAPDMTRGAAADDRAAGAAPSGAAADAVDVSARLDDAFDVLSVPQRRAVCYRLVDEPGPTSVESLAAWLAAVGPAMGHPSWADSERDLAITLRHAHLPKLAAAGVVEVDAANGAVRYEPDPALEAFLGRARRLELGDTPAG